MSEGLTDTGRSPSGRLPLRRTQSLRRLLLTVRLYYNPWTQGAHLSGRLPLRRTQSMRGQLLSVAWGSTLGSGLCCESAEIVLTFTTQHRQQTTSPSPQLLIQRFIPDRRLANLPVMWPHLVLPPSGWQHSICPLGHLGYTFKPVCIIGIGPLTPPLLKRS